MRSYFAKQENKLHSGGWLTVIHWAKKCIKKDHTPVIIFTARAEDKYAKIIAEITIDGERLINSGRMVSLKSLLNEKI